MFIIFEKKRVRLPSPHQCQGSSQ